MKNILKEDISEVYLSGAFYAAGVAMGGIAYCYATGETPNYVSALVVSAHSGAFYSISYSHLLRIKWNKAAAGACSIINGGISIAGSIALVGQNPIVM